MKSPIRVGVIGAGVMGAHHARIYSELPGWNLVGLFDPDVNRATQLVSRYGGTAYRQMNDLFANVDAISIVSPTTTHAIVAHRALEFDLHVLVEKPMTASVNEARQLAREARRHQRVFLVGHIERFNPAVRELRQIIEGAHVRRVTLRRIAPFNNRCLDTDVISDLMIHDIDLVQSLFGSEIETIAAQGTAVRTEHIDQAVVELSLRGGPRVSLVASRIGDVHEREINAAVDGTCILADLLHRTISITNAPASDGRSVTEQYNVPPAEPLRLELEHFLNCIRGDEGPLVTQEAGLHAIEWVDRIVSLINQRSVDLRRGVQIGGIH